MLAEALGSALLAGVVIGSGILASKLADGNDGVALLANSAATAAILFVLVTTLGPVSGAHFNPAVTLAFALRGEIGPLVALGYVVVQIAGCVGGAVWAHAMFEAPLVQIGATARAGPGQLIAEATATFGLVLAIFGAVRHRPEAVPSVVALVILAGYWWTSSTSFANPAITLGRALTDSFAGIRPQDAPGFIAAQLGGGVLATLLAGVLFARPAAER